MRLFLVRHGETYANVARQLDTAYPGADLTETGHAQARELAHRLERRLERAGPAGIYTSDLVRTQQTARPLAATLGIDPVPLRGLREIQAGDYEMSTDWVPFVEAVAQWREDPRIGIPGGDSGVGFLTRYEAAIRRIAEDGEETVVAVSHGAAMRVWCATRLELGSDFFEGRRVGNALVVTLEGDPDDGWRLLAWGDEPIQSIPRG